MISCDETNIIICNCASFSTPPTKNVQKKKMAE